ncbi:PilZ domain-containing protein [Altererythrobacter sp. B11]|nr:PilZ domain-containing protein [Altererythrobacter sp. B11]
MSGSEAEQRAAPRFTLLIRAAKLTCDAGEYLCVVRDVSETGVSVRLFCPLPADCELTLEMSNGDRHRLERVWEEPDKAGFRFADPVDIERIIGSPSRFSKRSIRVNLEVPVMLQMGERTLTARMHNISQQGALVSCSEHLSIDQRLRLSARGLPTIAAKVRWRGPQQYGLIFEDTFQFGELARLTAALQLNA